jgi:hypothetical protein
MQKHVRKIKELETRLQILVSQVNSTGFVGSLGRREPMGRPWEKQGLRSASLSKSRERSRSESMLRLRGGTKSETIDLRGTSSESEQSDDESKQAEASYVMSPLPQSGRTMPEGFLQVYGLVEASEDDYDGLVVADDPAEIEEKYGVRVKGLMDLYKNFGHGDTFDFPGTMMNILRWLHFDAGYELDRPLPEPVLQSSL